jgi:hypothetical protein
MCPNIIHRPFAVEGRDISVKDELPKGLKIQGMDDPSKYVQGYLVQGQIITALHRVTHPCTSLVTYKEILPTNLGIKY